MSQDRFCFGVRPRSLPGHHVTIIEFAGEKLGKEFKGLISMFNRMRRRRNEASYEVTGLISKQEAEHALETAAKYLETTRNEIQKENPQTKLP